MSKYLSVVFNIFKDYVHGLSSWNFLGYGTILTTGLIALGLIPIVCDIIQPMYTYVLPYLIIFLWAFLAGIIVKFLCFLFNKRKERTIQGKLINNLKMLSHEEVSIMKYVLGQDTGAIWLPIENSAVLSLYSRKCLLPISDLTSMRGIIGERTQCWAFIVPPTITNYIVDNEKEINEIWDKIPQAEDMNIYKYSLIM